MAGMRIVHIQPPTLTVPLFAVAADHSNTFTVHLKHELNLIATFPASLLCLHNKLSQNIEKRNPKGLPVSRKALEFLQFPGFDFRPVLADENQAVIGVEEESIARKQRQRTR
eukprot:TRINITY_DN7847_c0_g2_i1.p2 TRINITY_DN7847_c0_g2~~TRINITY_DN7847_c0_g2_i1.p2  ORF type:complete len:112 (-),score=14.03 TRINITY_DN7847_c0_g2_i1:40-375(-)